VFALSSAGTLTALNATTGTQIWQISLANENNYLFDAPPTALNGNVYVAGSGVGATIFAIREAGGSVAWSSYMGEASDWSSPTISADTIFLSFTFHDYGFDLSTGAPLWAYGNPYSWGGGGATTAIYDHLLFTSDVSSNRNGVAQKLTTGRIALDFGKLTNTMAYESGVGYSYPPAFQGGIGYFIPNSGLLARQIPSGKILWHFSSKKISPEFFSTAPIVVNGMVFVTSETRSPDPAKGTLWVLNGVTGKVEYQILLPPSGGQNYTQVFNGLAAGEGKIAVPFLDTVSVYRLSSAN
jgi:outer membrane protein assembly factor BamB